MRTSSLFALLMRSYRGLHKVYRWLLQLLRSLLKKKDRKRSGISLIKDFPFVTFFTLLLPLVVLCTSIKLFTKKPPVQTPVFSKIIAFSPESNPEKDFASHILQEQKYTLQDAVNKKSLWVQHWRAENGQWQHQFTQDHFYCRGEFKNTFREVQDGDAVSYSMDCLGGRFGHGFALYQERPWFSQTIVDFCNQLQEEGLSLTICEGHCCPDHLNYIEPKHLRTDRHIMGAAATIEITSNETEQTLWSLFLKASGQKSWQALPKEDVRRGYTNACSGSCLRIDLKKGQSAKWVVRLEAIKEGEKRVHFNWNAYTQFVRY